MATEYDIFLYEELNPLIQQKISNSIQRIAKICWKTCYKATQIPSNCVENCTANYIKAFDIVLNELKTISSDKK